MSWLRVICCGLLVACASEAAPMAPAAGSGAIEPLGPRIQPTARALFLSVAEQHVDPDKPDGLPDVGGQAAFTTTTIGMDLVIQAFGARAFASYPVRIVDAADCSQIATAPVWARGQNIPNILPLPNAGIGKLNYIQTRDDPHAWTIGGSRDTDIVGRAFVVYDASEPTRALSCGMIEATDTIVTPVETVAQERALPPRVRGTLAGLCSASLIATEIRPDCPDPVKAAECTSIHCDVASCVAPCAEYTACLQQRGDACAADCVQPPECLSCVLRATYCSLDFCESVLYCAPPPTPGGPCDKVRECCRKQGERAEYCLNTVDRYEKLSGNPTCIGLMGDPPFNQNIAKDCMWH